MNTQIAEAVRNSRGRDETTVWDRLFSFWFQRLVYTQTRRRCSIAFLPIRVGREQPGVRHAGALRQRVFQRAHSIWERASTTASLSSACFACSASV
jgi:hypothetical protein